MDALWWVILLLLALLTSGIVEWVRTELLHGTHHVLSPLSVFAGPNLTPNISELVSTYRETWSPYMALKEMLPAQTSEHPCAYCGSKVPANAPKCESCGART